MEPTDRTDALAALAALAARHGVATSYRNWRREPVEVDDDTVRAVLAAMGVDASTDAATRVALDAAERQTWQRPLPPTVVARENAVTEVLLRTPAATTAPVVLHLEDGTTRTLAPEGELVAQHRLDGATVVARRLTLPRGLPVGAHRLALEDAGARHETFLYVVPPRLRAVRRLSRSWGWMVQLYALRHRGSWGIGDLGSLRRLLDWSVPAHGADFVLINPLHAAAPTTPRNPSPYYPTSRRFVDPLVIDIDALPEMALLDERGRSRVAELAARARRGNARDGIDRDGAFAARQEALELLFAADAGNRRRAEFAAFRAAGGAALEQFATWSALAEAHGTPWQRWPASLHDPGGAAVERFRRDHARRITFHAWLQWCCDQQLADIQRAARTAGAAIGVVHDLAVGVDPGGADAWALQDVIAARATVGAPPDEFNRRGQDWGLPPLLPQALRDTGYRTFREIAGAALRHAGGVRIDHALGLFRLYWIPEGADPSAGTYVSYPAEDLLGILTMDADAADAVVVAEDLGTVPEGTTDALRRHGILSSEVLYFARDDDDRLLTAGDYDPLTFASVTTHDLPTAAGWWTDESIRQQDRLGQLGAGRTLEEVLADAAAQKTAMRRLLHAAGALADPAERDVRELVLAMYRFLARTPALLVAAWLPDAVGDLRQPNLPGTGPEYPNWCLPIAEPTSDEGEARPVLLESLRHDPRVQELVEAVRRR